MSGVCHLGGNSDRPLEKSSARGGKPLLRGTDGGGGEGADRERSAELRRARSDWISRSLCSLAVRYQAAAHECSVQSCLNSFTAPELLTGSNKYGCDNCTRRRDAQNAAASSSGEPSTDSGALNGLICSSFFLFFLP